MNEHLYTIDLSGVTVGLACADPRLAAGLARWFDRPCAELPPTVHLDLEFVLHDDEPELPTSLLTTKRLTADGFDIADGLIRGRFDRATGRGSLRAKAILLEGLLPRIFEQVLYQAHASARQLALQPGFLLHSAAVIADGRGYLFVGPSGAGKSTVARQSAEWHVLGDEMNLVVPGPDGYEVAGTPFNGTFREKTPGRAPLAGIFLLRQAPRHAVVPVGAAEAAAAVTAEIMPPVGLDEVPTTATVPEMMDLAAALVARVPTRCLEFLPDSNFWKVILDSNQGTTDAAVPGKE